MVNYICLLKYAEFDFTLHFFYTNVYMTVDHCCKVTMNTMDTMNKETIKEVKEQHQNI